MKLWFWAAAASGPVALGLWWLGGLSPATVEAWYSRTLYPLLMGPWSRLTGLSPLPVVLFLLGAAVIGVVALFLTRPFGQGLSLMGAGLSVLVAWFVLGWGLNYQRQSWADNHGWKAVGGSVVDLEALAHRLAEHASVLRRTVGEVAWDSVELRRQVSLAYEAAGRFDPLLAGRYGDPKPFPWPELMSWVGIGGICIPHTGEPLVNTGPKTWMLPFTSAHEAAHLRGWAREDEANFLAFWVLRDSPNPALAYSAWSAALLYTANALGQAGEAGQEAWRHVAPKVDAAIFEDWRAYDSYWERFRGPVMKAAETVNDLYLKSQGQSLGVRSYGRMVDLLLAAPWETPSVPAAR